MHEPVIDDEVRAAVHDFEQELRSLYGSKLRGLYLRPHERVEGVRVADVVIVLDDPERIVAEIHRTTPAIIAVEGRHDVFLHTVIISGHGWDSNEPLGGRGGSRTDLVPA